MAQAKGSATRVIMDWEASYNTPRAAVNRVPIQLPFNTTDLKGSRSLQQAQTIRGDRNPAVPFQGNKDVAGNLVTPVDPRAFGYLLCGLMGYPVTTEAPGTAGDYKTGSPTVSIAGGTGAYTFSVAQTSSKLGDRVVYIKDGVQYIYYITTRTDDTTGILKDWTGGTVAANVTGAAVVSISNNRLNATHGTVTIASGIATFTNAPIALTAGQVLIYGADAAHPKYAIIGTPSSGTVAPVTGSGGTNVVPDVTAAVAVYLGAAGQWTHVYKVNPTTAVPSLVLELGYQDLAAPYFDLFQGVKINSLEISVGGDGELVATWGLVGAENNGIELLANAYDHESGAKNAAALFTSRFEQRDAYAEEAGVAVTSLGEFKINLTNALDTSSFVIGGGGVRDDLPEGIFGAGGSLVALFRDTAILVKAQQGTESSLAIGFDRSPDLLVFSFPEVMFQDTSTGISGPAGIRLPLDFQAFYGDGTQASAVVVTLTNNIKDFALA